MSFLQKYVNLVESNKIFIGPYRFKKSQKMIVLKTKR